MTAPTTPATDAAPSHFIRNIIDDDRRLGKWSGRVETRFPPEPNGYLHYGHAKSICLNFGLAQIYGGACHLRFDDTNPAKEDQEYVDAIIEAVQWLGFDWQDHLYFASDYFDKMYAMAEHLITVGKAYVESLSADEMRAYRGTLSSPGRNSPFRERSVSENLELFQRMKAGEFPDGTHILRARIDMASPNMNLRDPAIYRIRHAAHHRTGERWCIYPMYTFAHPIEDALEDITHSICTLEFADQRPFYEWLLETRADGGFFSRPVPQQIEFARLNLTYTLMSKRKLLKLVQDGVVSGWNDPRMPTLAGIRRRGVPAAALRDFCDRIGVAKKENVIDVALLEHCVREDLNRHARRVMAVLDPVKVVIENYPAGQVESLEAVNNPEDPAAGVRQVPFSREIYIDRDDFREDPPKKYFRLSPGAEVRLRWAYIIRCTSVVKDADGTITEIRCTYDEATGRSSTPADGRKVKGTIHWVSAPHAIDVEARLYDRLFTTEDPEAVPEGKDFVVNLNPASLEVVTACKAEPSVAGLPAGTTMQFERTGYFCVDPDSTSSRLVVNRTVGLRDTWAKLEARG